MMLLTDLPPELIHLIFTCLDVKDVRRSRLSCRTLKAIAASHAFPELSFYLHPSDFEMLRHFADHPEYARNVRSVVYGCDVLKPRCLSFKKFVIQKQDTDNINWDIKQWQHKQYKKPGPPPPLPQKDSDEFLQEAYERYKQTHDQQTRIIAEGRDFSVLKSVIPQFSNLKDITVSADHCFREGENHKTPFNGLLVHAYDFLEPAGCRQAGSVLMALVGLPTGHHLRSLRLGTIDWSFLEQLQEPSRLDHMVEICRNLSTFELYLDTGANPDASWEWDDVGTHMTECRAAVQKGGLRRLLGSMTELEVLTVGFTYPNETSGLYPATLGDLVPEGMHWQSLREFRFNLVEATRQEVVDFVRRHSSTVTHIYLQDLRLLRSSWLVFLPELRDLGEEMFLDDVLISGTVYGETEGKGPLEGTLTGEVELWELGNPDISGGPCLADEISNYIIWGDCENPLEHYDDSESSDLDII